MVKTWKKTGDAIHIWKTPKVCSQDSLLLFIQVNHPKSVVCMCFSLSIAIIKGICKIVTLEFGRNITKQFTLPRTILSCPINWGTQWTMEVTSNE